ncbi:MAG: MFS transporter [Rhodospirillales bacterium]
MAAALMALSALLLSIFLLLGGNGLLGTLLALGASSAGFSTTMTGLIMSGYFIGFFVGCFAGPTLVRRVGHIRVFAGMAAIACAVALLHALLRDPLAWTALRFVSGICFASLSMVIESWLNDAADNRTRGTVISTYVIVDRSAIALGALAVGLAPVESFTLFAIVAIAICLALVPVSLASGRAPAPITQAKLRPLWLYRISPVGVVGCFAVGLANAAFMSLAPLFATQTGFNPAEVGLFMAVLVMGGLASQWPLGWLSDRMDRRLLLIVLSVATAAFALGTAFLPALWAPSLFILSALLGAALLPIYSITIAHANDYMKPEDFVSASGGLLLAYGAGAMAGPFIASTAMTVLGAWALFVHLAAVYLASAAFIGYRRLRRPGVGPQDKVDFVAVPRTTPAVFEVDPRAEDHVDEQAGEEANAEAASGAVDLVEPALDQPTGDGITPRQG